MAIFGTMTINGDLTFGNTNAAIYGQTVSGTYERAISFPAATSGILHGTWQADSAVGTSDRRLKTNIAPLHQSLLSHMARAKGPTIKNSGGWDRAPAANDNVTENTSILEKEADIVESSSSGPARNGRRDAVEWVLRELRPVSFTFRQGADSKNMNHQRQPRYGFVAQEVEKVVPDLVVDTGATKSMMYQDFIAMITLAAQDHQERLEQQTSDVGKLKSLLKRLGEKLSHLQKRVARVIGPLEAAV
jgi:hypothetical protein